MTGNCGPNCPDCGRCPCACDCPALDEPTRARFDADVAALAAEAERLRGGGTNSARHDEFCLDVEYGWHDAQGEQCGGSYAPPNRPDAINGVQVSSTVTVFPKPDTWPQRQAVITAMQRVIREAQRQMDAAQVGAPLDDRWFDALDEARDARVRYRCEVTDGGM